MKKQDVFIKKGKDKAKYDNKIQANYLAWVSYFQTRDEQNYLKNELKNELR